jgi:hypothetical protein
MPHESLRYALCELIASPAFVALEERLRNRSALHILGIDRRELSHAALLAWVLDPRASHGMGSTPLRRFLLAAASFSQVASSMLDPIDIDELDLDALITETEVPILDGRRRLDVLVSQPPSAGNDERGAPVLVIEYKVDAAEGEDQTAAYAQWASTRPVAMSRSGVLALQVFLCPDRNAGKPHSPFVYLDYDAYLGWLVGLAELDQSARAKFLLTEFRDCLAQRDDVTDVAADRLVERIREGHAKAINSLTNASPDALAAFRAVFSRHGQALSVLGISLGRRSLGDSAFVVAVRKGLQARLRADLWSHSGGAGSVRSVFLPASAQLREQHGLLVQLWMARPRRGLARVSIEVVSRTAIRDGAHTAMRDAVAASLRSHPGASRIQANAATQSTVVTFRLEAPGIDEPESDTEDAVRRAQPALDRALDSIALVEAWLIDWATHILPGLVAPSAAPVT